MKKYLSKFKGFTLAELLIVIVIIGILAAAMMMASDETVSSARATKIINDLMNLKIAVHQWYLNNLSKVARYDDSSKTYLTANNATRAQQKGKIIIGTKIGSPQHYTGSELGLYDYFSGPIILVNQVSGDYGNGVGQAASTLKPGNYGFYDAGTREDNSTPWNTCWLVGYAFKEDEDKVKKKVFAHSELGLIPIFGLDPWQRMNTNSSISRYYSNHKLKNIEDADSVWITAIDLEAE